MRLPFNLKQGQTLPDETFRLWKVWAEMKEHYYLLKQPRESHEDDTAESVDREHPSSILPKVMWRDGRDHGSWPWVWSAGMTLNKSGGKHNLLQNQQKTVGKKKFAAACITPFVPNADILKCFKYK